MHCSISSKNQHSQEWLCCMSPRRAFANLRNARNYFIPWECPRVYKLANREETDATHCPYHGGEMIKQASAQALRQRRNFLKAAGGAAVALASVRDSIAQIAGAGSEPRKSPARN